jgi:hypothetical protein
MAAATGPRLGAALVLLLGAAPAPVTATDPLEAPHACGLCGAAGGCLSTSSDTEGDSVRCSGSAPDWPTASTPGFIAGMAPLGRGVDYVGGGDLPGGGKVSSTEECCAKCSALPTCKVWVTTDKPVDFCWLKAWPGGLTTNKGAPGIPRADLRWTGLACQCDAACRTASAAATGFSSVVLLSAALYLGGGAMYKRRKGATGWDLLLHRQQMDHLRGLILDGVVFCHSGGATHPAGAGPLHAPLTAATAGGEDRDGGTKRPKSKKNRAKKEGQAASPERAEKPPAPPRAAPDSAPALATKSGRAEPAASTTAGSGGRWVHVS